MNFGKIVISRKNQSINYGRGYTIFIDSQKVGKISDGETKTFEVTPKSTEVYVKIDWCKTKPLKIDLKADEIVNLEVGSNVTTKKILFGYTSHYYLFKSTDFLYLKTK